jgi:Tfp pilus assembly PilM family ATPase
MAERARNINNLLSLKALSFQQLRKKLRVRPPGVTTVIDLDGQWLRVVQAAQRGVRSGVTRIAAEKLDLPAEADRTDPAILGKGIAKTLARLRIKPAAVVMGVPRALVVLRSLSLPVIEDVRELAAMVHFQISKDLPFHLDEAAIDFTVRRRLRPTAQAEGVQKAAEATEETKGEAAPEAPKLEVLVAAVKREVVEFYQATAAAAGLKLAALGWLSYANARCLEACRMTEGDKGVALISLRPDEVGIDVIVQQSLLFSREAGIKVPAEAAPNSQPLQSDHAPGAAPVEGSAPVESESFVEAVTIEVVRSLHSYGGMEPHLPVVKLVVAGVTGHEAAVVQALKNRLNAPCSLLEPATALDLPRAAREHAAGSISALGLALGVTDAQGLPFDFLNPKRPAVVRNMRRVRFMMGAAAAAAIFLLLLGAQRRLINQREIQLKRLKSELAEATTHRPIYRQMRLQATTAQDWVRGSRNWLDHYAYLSAIFPSSEEIYLSSLSVSGQGSIRLAVQARSGDVLARLDKQLRAAGYAVKPLAITPGADRFGCNFRSNVELAATPEMLVDLAKFRPPARPADDASLDTPKHARKGGGP